MGRYSRPGTKARVLSMTDGLSASEKTGLSRSTEREQMTVYEQKNNE